MKSLFLSAIRFYRRYLSPMLPRACRFEPSCSALALANSFATALEATALFIFMRQSLNGINGRHIARGFVRCSGAALGMALALWIWIQASADMNRWIAALGGVALGGLVYLAGVLVFKVPEVQMMLAALTRRLRRSSP